MISISRISAFSKLAGAGLIALVSLQALASEPLIVHYQNTRGQGNWDVLKLNSDLKTCTRWNMHSTHRVKGNVATEQSEACDALRIAQIIESKLGSCQAQGIRERTERGDNNFSIKALSGHGGYAYESGQSSSSLVPAPTTYNLDFLNNSIESSDHLTPPNFLGFYSGTNQSCLCLRHTRNEYKVGLGMLNVLELFFNGPYYRVEDEVRALSSEECQEFFSSDSEKQVVREAYKSIQSEKK